MTLSCPPNQLMGLRFIIIFSSERERLCLPPPPFTENRSNSSQKIPKCPALDLAVAGGTEIATAKAVVWGGGSRQPLEFGCVCSRDFQGACASHVALLWLCLISSPETYSHPPPTGAGGQSAAICAIPGRPRPAATFKSSVRAVLGSLSSTPSKGLMVRREVLMGP